MKSNRSEDRRHRDLEQILDIQDLSLRAVNFATPVRHFLPLSIASCDMSLFLFFFFSVFKIYIKPSFMRRIVTCTTDQRLMGSMPN